MARGIFPYFSYFVHLIAKIFSPPKKAKIENELTIRRGLTMAKHHFFGFFKIHPNKKDKDADSDKQKYA